MRQIAHAPEELLYKEFGIDAELLIDHSWGRESVTMEDLQAYKPKNNSICSGQVLFKDYPYDEALVVVKEMGDDIALQLSRKKKKATGMVLGVGMAGRSGGGGRHMSISFSTPTQNDLEFRNAAATLFRYMVGKEEYVRRFMISLSGIVDDEAPRQLDLFQDNEEAQKRESLQKAILSIKDTYGKNAILKGMDYEEGATQKDRNVQIGGHKSGV